MPVVLTTQHDPYANVALESLLFEQAGEHGPFLMLWVNATAVVLGRHQNPWVECNMAALKQDGVPLVRRISGGGTVYHDPGNLNFSFLASSGEYDLDAQFDLVIRALARVGLQTERTERNDLVADGRKFSGNAFRHSRGNSLHHGTLLVNSDLARLSAYLAAPDAEIETKAIASVRSAVVNLSELAPELTTNTLVDTLTREFADRYSDNEVIVADSGDGWSTSDTAAGATHALAPGWFPSAAAREAEKERLTSWEWLFGHTPTFRRTYRAGELLLSFRIKKGVIDSVEVSGAGQEWKGETLTGFLAGRPFQRETLEALGEYDWAVALWHAIREDLW
jgi:lipoate-protein ligase A